MKYNSASSGFTPWQPSTWPNPPAVFDADFAETLKQIFKETILNEISNVISDAKNSGHGLVHRGHVVALAMLCAIDTISSYAFPKIKVPCPTCDRSDAIGSKYQKFIADFFPPDYQPFAKDIYDLYRNSIVHSWNLFQAGMLPGNDPITNTNGGLSFGLLNFFEALQSSVENFLSKLPLDQNLQVSSMDRYKKLKESALP